MHHVCWLWRHCHNFHPSASLPPACISCNSVKLPSLSSHWLSMLLVALLPSRLDLYLCRPNSGSPVDSQLLLFGPGNHDSTKSVFITLTCLIENTTCTFPEGSLLRPLKRVYLVSAALTGLQAGQDLALYSRNPGVAVLQALSLKVPRLPGERHDDKVCILFVCK